MVKREHMKCLKNVVTWETTVGICGDINEEMVRSVGNYKSKFCFLKKIALAVILCGVLLSLPSLCRAHSENNPSFKYSREANENFDHKKDAGIHHHHDHDHDHHDHDHHDHDHDHIHEYHAHHEGEHLHSHKHDNRQNDKSTRAKTDIDMSSIWIHSIGSTLLISAAPYILLYVIPLDNSEAMKPRLKVLLAFASGGLLGDAFLHLIPHAAHPHIHTDGNDHDHDHDHHNVDDEHGHGHGHGHSHGHDMTIGLWVLGGIIAFLSVEKLVRLLKGGVGHSHNHGGQSHSKPAKPAKKAEVKTDEKADQKTKAKNAAPKKNESYDHEGEVEISGYLNLAADFAHNFTDGLAIGASYLAGNSIGIVTTLTILLHEVPHEIGDFAILIKSGCSRRKAMLLQLVTAFGAIVGTALALISGGTGSEASPSWVLPFTAGGFIYIATVSVLPELLEESTKLWQSIKEIVALLTGVVLMVFIANLE